MRIVTRESVGIDHGFVDVTSSEIRNGSWLEKAANEWRRGNVGAIRVLPDSFADKRLMKLVENLIDSDGIFAQGDYVLIRAREPCLDIAYAAASVFERRGIDYDIVLTLFGLEKEISQLVDSVPRARSLTALEDLKGLVGSYKSLTSSLMNCNAHFITIQSAAPNTKRSSQAALYGAAIQKGFADLALAFDYVKSSSTWFYPNELARERINGRLQADKRLGSNEWRDLILDSMSIQADELTSRALENDSVQALIYASLHGGVLHYTHEAGTSLKYMIQGRSIMVDEVRVGNRSIGGTAPNMSKDINAPCGEAFGAPLEHSAEGIIVCAVPLRTYEGLVEAPYKIYVKDGMIYKIEAPDNDSFRVLQHYTGLRSLYDTDGREDTYEKRKVIAEAAIGGLNPALCQHISDGRLFPIVGVPSLDEKLGDHFAFGGNRSMGGNTPNEVPHTDFVVGSGGRLRLIK